MLVTGGLFLKLNLIVYSFLAVDMLLNWKVDINQLDGKTFSPLMTAAQYGMGQIASYLIGKVSR